MSYLLDDARAEAEKWKQAALYHAEREAHYRKAIEDAPHGVACKSDIVRFWDVEHETPMPCNCWKHAALAEEKK